MVIDLEKLKYAIKARHHAMQRFYDIGAAATDRERNLEMLNRIENGTASREDEESAIDLIRAH